MKECSNCKHLYREGYEEYYYVCELFGDDIPDWANHPNDECCLLKSQEVDKMIRLSENFVRIGTGKKLDEYGFPEWTKEDEERNKEATKKYNEYIEILKKRCEDRKNTIFAEEIIKELEDNDR